MGGGKGGGGSLNLEILKGREGCSISFGNPGGREGVQKYAFHRGGGVDFFWNNPFNIFKLNLFFFNVSYWVTEALGTLNFIGLLYIISSHEAIT